MLPRPITLIIRDGWGIRAEREGNAPLLADTPVFDSLIKTYPNTILYAAERYVGLPRGIMGNSEVGHINLGAGRVVMQESTRIRTAIEEDRLKDIEPIQKAFENVKANNSMLHFFGLASDALVHSELAHLYALIELARSAGVRDACIHAFTDGRDTSPTSGINYIKDIEKRCAEIGLGRIATLSGRYYAMDRDNRWDRVEKAYLAITRGLGEKANSAQEAVENSYKNGITDEFILPTVIVNDDDSPVGAVKPEDSVIFFNFRADRARELTKAFLLQDFDSFERERFINPYFVCLTEYEQSIPAPVAFPPHKIENNLATILARYGKKQLRIAETEKYAHVTFFFSSGVEEPVTGEDRCLIPSPRVATYDLQPEMSAYLVTDEVIKRIESREYDVIILNFANPDMVGHTGVLSAAINAVEVVDACVGRVADAVRTVGGVSLVTADHGNCELMLDPETDGPHTAHTTNPVHFILVDDNKRDARLLPSSEEPKLADVAPTILHYLDIEKPAAMTGRSLIL